MKIRDKNPNRPPWRPRKIAAPEELIESFVAYAKDVEENPFYTEKIFIVDGGVLKANLRVARPMTIAGFCNFLGVSSQAWRYWRAKRKDLAEAIEIIDGAVFAQKFEGAAAGIFKANIISRDLARGHQS
ncbi:terminase small subunit [Roseibium sp. MMSF_3544]|uniref:terminase small subunit n=1 Tax=unclassified Roseibium TaxID=2629323 RepID=UPI00273DD7EC|nr:terminase small subunit [Roseibium sp. MMSF_3544]